MVKFVVVSIIATSIRLVPKMNFLYLDTLNDATAGHEMFLFMDGFSDYSQIRMALEDAEKTAFRTLFWNFYYCCYVNWSQ